MTARRAVITKWIKSSIKRMISFQHHTAPIEAALQMIV
jgi:hypothetical protein